MITTNNANTKSNHMTRHTNGTSNLQGQLVSILAKEENATREESGVNQQENVSINESLIQRIE